MRLPSDHPSAEARTGGGKEGEVDGGDEGEQGRKGVADRAEMWDMKKSWRNAGMGEYGSGWAFFSVTSSCYQDIWAPACSVRGIMTEYGTEMKLTGQKRDSWMRNALLNAPLKKYRYFHPKQILSVITLPKWVFVLVTFQIVEISFRQPNIQKWILMHQNQFYSPVHLHVYYPDVELM